MMCFNTRRSTMLLLPLAWILGGCGDQIVYRDRDRNAFEQPITGAGSFLGYSNAESKRTTCGNCHSGKQATWQETKHATAWSGLVASGKSQPECEACHSVSALGNIATDTAVGYVGTKSSRYQDVQCESCHGPGLTHVSNPDVKANKPLASLQVGTNLTRGCGECHSGAHQPFAEQWAASRHARVIVSRATNPSCVGCHEARGILTAWGVKSTFAEEAATTDYLAVTCAVCHDPHDKRNPGQLRYSMETPSLETNLCMKCHYRRAQPEVASSSGPHSPQGPMLLGEAGWIPPNFTYPEGSLVGSHGSDRNPRLCATCHVNKYTVTDKVTGAFTFRSTGHSFLATPCVDANGIPTATQTCDVSQRSYASCTSCHLTENAARTALSVARDRLDRLATQVEGMLPRIPANQFSTTDNKITTAEGAKFNAQLAREVGAAAHNPFLAEALLLASIKQIQTDYGITPATAVNMTPMLAPKPQSNAPR